MPKYKENFDESFRLRDEFWNTVGTKEKDVLSFLINPSLVGGPRWPSLRQSFILVRTQKSNIIASDGLTDPFDDMETNPENAKYNGFGLEFFAETKENIKTLEDAKKSLAFDMVNAMSQFAASHGNIIGLLNDMDYITTELQIPAPQAWRNEHGRVGVILGLLSEQVPSTVKLSIEPVRMVNIKLLTLRELAYAVEKEASGRKEIADRLRSQGDATVSSFDRKSVI